MFQMIAIRRDNELFFRLSVDLRRPGFHALGRLPSFLDRRVSCRSHGPALSPPWQQVRSRIRDLAQAGGICNAP